MGLRACCPTCTSLVGRMTGCLPHQQSSRLHRFFPPSLLSVAIPCLPIWRLLGRLHDVNHRVVLHGEALLKGEGVVPMYPCQPSYYLAVPDRTVVNRMQGWDTERLKSFAETLHLSRKPSIFHGTPPSFTETLKSFTEPLHLSGNPSIFDGTTQIFRGNPPSLTETLHLSRNDSIFHGNPPSFAETLKSFAE